MFTSLNVRHVLSQAAAGTESPTLAAERGTIRPGAVDPETGSKTPEDSDFKFRTIESAHEATVKVQGLTPDDLEVVERSLREGLKQGDVRFRSLEVRSYANQDPQDGLADGQTLFALTRIQTIDLEAFLKFCTKAIAPFPAATILDSQQGCVIDWSTSNVHNLVYAPDSGPATPMVENEEYDHRAPSIVLSRNDSVDAGVNLVSHV